MLAVAPVTSLKLWLILILAVVLLTPLTHASLRRVVLALLNLLFVWFCVGALLPAVLVGLLLIYTLLHFARGRHAGAAGGLVLAVGIGTLFVLHKLPPLAAWAGLSALNPLLAGIGFSYVMLRVVDVWRAVREGLRPAPGLIALTNYLLPFHMLAAGPIQAYEDFVRQPPVPPPPDAEGVLQAVERIVAGLFKKFVLADLLCKLFSTGWNGTGWYLWLEINLHFLWLYLDFSAYSDIAVGCGRLLGLNTPENFNRPYLARNLTEFWERWHITLSQFIRRHLFVPLQMALLRRTDGRHALPSAGVAIAVSFLLCGAWHGLTPAFLAWGSLHAAGLIACALYREWLRRRLSPAALARYQADPLIRGAAVFATYQFVALSLWLVGDQWKPGW